MKWIPLYTLILCALVGPALGRDIAPADLLKRAANADKHVDYRGKKTATITFGRGSAHVVMKVIHLRPDMTRTEYFSPDALAGMIMIQNGPDLWKYRPREEAWEQIRCPCPSTEVIRAEAFRNYDLRLVGTERIAGRVAHVIRAIPHNRGDASHRLWVDRESDLIIATQVESDSGAVLRSSRYVNLSVNPGDISRSVFQISGKVLPAPKRPKSGPDKVLRPAYLPNGYKLVSTSRLNLNGFGCAHLQYSNGASAISLFQQQSSDEVPKGLVNSKVTNVITWVRDGMRLTLMGDISKAELKKIADSIK